MVHFILGSPRFFMFYVILFSAIPCFSQQVIGAGNYNGVNITTSDNASEATGTSTLNGQGLLPNLSAASRFLAQATLGADYESIESTAQGSLEDWIDTQLNMPLSNGMEDRVESLYQDLLDITAANGDPTNDIEPWGQYWQYAWWDYTMTSPDVLRQRMALALSEILVISSEPDLGTYPYALANYYDILLEHAFGNYRDLLEDMSLHPAMGIYLSHLSNRKADFTINRFPDENFAREIMQLFSIGLYELNLDGSHMLDNQGNDIPTYNNFDIAQLARVFTGLSWGTSTPFGAVANSNDDFIVPMQMYNDWHEPGQKTIVGGHVIPSRNPVNGMADIQDALDHLFNHQNVGPFIAIRLIQRLVTSNPSPEYIARVATVFNNNGQGVRGDLGAVLKAILLDPEARDCSLIEHPHHGMLREPLVRHIHLNRAFNATSDAGVYHNPARNILTNLEQRALSAPSVFNFFKPDYQPIGAVSNANLVAPEFQIASSQTTINYITEAYNWAMQEDQAMEVDAHNFYDNVLAEHFINLDLSDELAIGDASNIGALVERLNLILVHGYMSENTRNIITTTLAKLPDDFQEERVRMAIYLVMMSPDYLIFR